MSEDVEKDVLTRLAQVIEARRGGDPESSYVARLLARGTDGILKKIGEEATETVMAAKDGDRQRIVAETADLWFHCLVMLAHFDLAPADVYVFCSDGVFEANDALGREFGAERLLQIVQDTCAQSARAIVDAIFTAVLEFRADTPPNDDMTAVALKITG